VLENEHGFDVESVAGAGDRVEDMAYSGGQLANFKNILEKLLRRTELPKAILLSTKSGGATSCIQPKKGFKAVAQRFAEAISKA
jgi:hypothetical protein